MVPTFEGARGPSGDPVRRIGVLFAGAGCSYVMVRLLLVHRALPLDLFLSCLRHVPLEVNVIMKWEHLNCRPALEPFGSALVPRVRFRIMFDRANGWDGPEQLPPMWPPRSRILAGADLETSAVAAERSAVIPAVRRLHHQCTPRLCCTRETWERAPCLLPDPARRPHLCCLRRL